MPFIAEIAAYVPQAPETASESFHPTQATNTADSEVSRCLAQHTDTCKSIL